MHRQLRFVVVIMALALFSVNAAAQQVDWIKGWDTPAATTPTPPAPTAPQAPVVPPPQTPVVPTTPTTPQTPPCTPAKVVSFQTDRSRIVVGEEAKLTWQVSDANPVLLNGINVAGKNELTVKPTQGVAYKLEAFGKCGVSPATSTVQVAVSKKPFPWLGFWIILFIAALIAGLLYGLFRRGRNRDNTTIVQPPTPPADPAVVVVEPAPQPAPAGTDPLPAAPAVGTATVEPQPQPQPATPAPAAVAVASATPEPQAATATAAPAAPATPARPNRRSRRERTERTEEVSEERTGSSLNELDDLDQDLSGPPARTRKTVRKSVKRAVRKTAKAARRARIVLLMVGLSGLLSAPALAQTVTLSQNMAILGSDPHSPVTDVTVNTTVGGIKATSCDVPSGGVTCSISGNTATFVVTTKAREGANNVYFTDTNGKKVPAKFYVFGHTGGSVAEFAVNYAATQARAQVASLEKRMSSNISKAKAEVIKEATSAATTAASNAAKAEVPAIARKEVNSQITALTSEGGELRQALMKMISDLETRARAYSDEAAKKNDDRLQAQINELWDAIDVLASKEVQHKTSWPRRFVGADKQGPLAPELIRNK